MRTVFLVLIYIFVFGKCGLAQEYVGASLVLFSGDTLKGNVVPFSYFNTRIEIFETGQTKKTKVPSEDVDEIILRHGDEEVRYHNYYIGKFRSGGYKVKRYKKNCWATLIYESKQIEAFLLPYAGTKMGFSAVVAGIGGLTPQLYDASTSIGVRFPNMDEIIDINSKGIDSKVFRKRLLKYLTNQCLEFRKEMREKEEYEITDLEEVLDYYSKVCSEK